VNYVVTAINKLSGKREIISFPRSLEQSTAMLQKHLKKYKYKRHQPWKSFRIEESKE